MNKNKLENTLLEDIKYFPIRTVRYFDMLWRRIYWFFQRGFRGYGDNDLWNFDHYLATVISKGLKQFKKYYHGTEPTKKELNTIIEGFEANLKMMESHLNPKSKEYLILRIKFERGMDLLKRYFNYLWD